MAASARPPAAEPLIFSLVSSSLLLLSTASSFLCSVGAGGGGATASLFGVVLSWSSLRSDHNFLAQTEEGGGGESCKRANADELAGGSSPTSSFLPFLLLLLLLLSLLQHLLHAYLLFGELHLFGSLPHLICRSPGSRAEEGWKSGDVFGSLAWRRKWRAAARSVGLIGGLGAVIITINVFFPNLPSIFFCSSSTSVTTSNSSLPLSDEDALLIFEPALPSFLDPVLPGSGVFLVMVAGMLMLHGGVGWTDEADSEEFEEERVPFTSLSDLTKAQSQTVPPMPSSRAPRPTATPVRNLLLLDDIPEEEEHEPHPSPVIFMLQRTP